MESVAFAGIDDKLSLHSKRLERMPELIALGRGTFAIVLANDYQRGRLDILDKRDGRAFCVHGRIVINRGAKVRKHPLVDGILAVIALPVRDACARHGGAEAIGLGDREHRHVTAVAPAGHTDALLIYRIPRGDGVYSGENVAQVAVAKVLDVGCGEGLARAVAAARI